MGKSDKVYMLEESTTQQSGADECDINRIVAAAKRGADVSHVHSKTPMYGDFTGLPDFRESMTMITKANEMFMALDPFVRERFSNDPAKLLDFLADDTNREEAVKLGLVKAPEVPPKPDPLHEEIKGLREDLKKKKPKGDDD